MTQPTKAKNSLNKCEIESRQTILIPYKKTNLHWAREYYHYITRNSTRKVQNIHINGVLEINQFITYLVTERKISASTKISIERISFLYVTFHIKL